VRKAPPLFSCPEHTHFLSRLDQIAAKIQSTADRGKLLRLLNRAWWREYFEQNPSKSEVIQKSTPAESKEPVGK
jgi:hypothetical protein